MGGSECSGRPIFIFLLKKLGFAESNNNISLTKNLTINSGVRQRSHPLMIPLHCLWAKSNNRTRNQFESDVWCDDFIRLHARCGCCFVVCWKGTLGLKLDVQGQGGGKNFGHRWTGGRGRSWKLDNFLGSHMCIVPKSNKQRKCRILKSI